MTILYSVVSVRSIHSHRMKGDTPIALNVHQNEKIDIDKVTSAPKGQFILNGVTTVVTQSVVRRNRQQEHVYVQRWVKKMCY